MPIPILPKSARWRRQWSWIDGARRSRWSKRILHDNMEVTTHRVLWRQPGETGGGRGETLSKERSRSTHTGRYSTLNIFADSSLTNWVPVALDPDAEVYIPEPSHVPGDLSKERRTHSGSTMFTGSILRRSDCVEYGTPLRSISAAKQIHRSISYI